MLSPVDEIKSRLDLAEIVREYVPSLKKAGANWKALCPFHQEKTPSFMVSSAKQIWHCFGCGQGGDIFTFIQQIEGMEFPEALRVLARRANVTLKHFDPQRRTERMRLQDLLLDAARFFHAKLLQGSAGEHARAYASRRGLDSETIRAWRLGWAPDSWDALVKFLRSKRYSDEEIVRAGMAGKKDSGRVYDRFRNRLMFPIADHQGTIIGFTGRALGQDTEAKYVNTPETALYNKSRVIYGLDRARHEIRSNGYAVVVEGNMDVIASHQAGVRHAVAVSGTALTAGHVMMLKRYAPAVAFAFDEDDAGRQALRRSTQEVWRAGMDVRIISLSDAKDPDELIRSRPEEWVQAVEQAVPAMEYYLEQEARHAQTFEEKKQAVRSLLPLIAALQDPVEQDHYVHAVAGRLHIREEALREAFQRVVRGSRRRSSFRSGTPEAPDVLEGEEDAEGKMHMQWLALAAERMRQGVPFDSPVEEEMLESRLQPLYRFLFSYYTQQRTFSWNSFLQEAEREVPEQKGLWRQVALLHEEMADKVQDSRQVQDAWAQLSERIVQEHVRKLKQGLQREIEQYERQLQNAGTEEEKEQIRTKLTTTMKKFSELSSGITPGGNTLS